MNQSYYLEPRPLQAKPDQGMVIILEIFPGLFGFMGIGWIYAGYTTRGILMMLLWGAVIWGSYIVIASIAFFVSILTLGIGAFSYCCLCFIPLFQIIGPMISSLILNSRLR